MRGEIYYDIRQVPYLKLIESIDDAGYDSILIPRMYTRGLTFLMIMLLLEKINVGGKLYIGVQSETQFRLTQFLCKKLLGFYVEHIYEPDMYMVIIRR